MNLLFIFFSLFNLNLALSSNWSPFASAGVYARHSNDVDSLSNTQLYSKGRKAALYKRSQQSPEDELHGFLSQLNFQDSPRPVDQRAMDAQALRRPSHPDPVTQQRELERSRIAGGGGSTRPAQPDSSNQRMAQRRYRELQSMQSSNSGSHQSSSPSVTPGEDQVSGAKSTSKSETKSTNKSGAKRTSNSDQSTSRKNVPSMSGSAAHVDPEQGSKGRHSPEDMAHSTGSRSGRTPSRAASKRQRPPGRSGTSPKPKGRKTG